MTAEPDNLQKSFQALQGEMATLQAQLISTYAEIQKLRDKVDELSLHNRVIGPSFDAMKDYGYYDDSYPTKTK